MQTSAVFRSHSRKFNAHALARMRIAHHGAGADFAAGNLEKELQELTGGQRAQALR